MITVSYSIGVVDAVCLWEAADLRKIKICVGIAPLYLTDSSASNHLLISGGYFK